MRVYEKETGKSELKLVGDFGDQTTAGDNCYKYVEKWPETSELLLVTPTHIYRLTDLPDGYSWEEVMQCS